ncbi:MAG: Fe-S protein assembly co-chaperone HscB [Thioalkalispiraceae bacterium]|jgi:molecular chaperone HscB
MAVELTQNYFEIFGLPVAFQIDISILTERYRELQKTVHPDRFANSSDRDRRLAVQQAALINEALSTLKSPLKRARYILQLKGVTFDDENETTMDPEFLMEQMELREAVADVKAQDDPFSSLNQIMESIKNNMDKMIRDLQDLISKDELEAAKMQVQKLQFLEKLMHECEGLEQDLADAL